VGKAIAYDDIGVGEASAIAHFHMRWEGWKDLAAALGKLGQQGAGLCKAIAGSPLSRLFQDVAARAMMPPLAAVTKRRS
jgi:hypothetical protein